MHSRDLAKGTNDQLLLTLNRPRVIPQILAEFHLGSSTTSYNVRVLDRSSNDHNSIVQTPFHLSDELFSTTTKDERTRLCLWAFFKDVESLSTDLTLLELAA